MGALNHMRPEQEKAPDRLGTKKKGGYRPGSGKKPGSKECTRYISASLIKRILLSEKRAKKKYGFKVEDELFNLIYSSDPKQTAGKTAALKLYYDLLSRPEKGEIQKSEISSIEPIVSLPELKIV